MSKRKQTQPEQPPQVRGRPFQPGNPGRPPGSKNKTTRLIEELFEGEAQKLTRAVINRALAGDVRCLLYSLDRASPQRRGQPINVQLPPIKSAQDLAPAMAAISAAVSNGELTPEEASHLAIFLNSCEKALVVNDFAVRLQNIETVVKMKEQMGG